MPAKKQGIDDLDASRNLDPRWTHGRLIGAGYLYTGDGACKSCGDLVSFYKLDPLRAADRVRWVIMDDGAAGVHECKGRR